MSNTQAAKIEKKMQEMIASRETSDLLVMARELNLNTTREGMLVGSMVESELLKRLPEVEFVALMDELEAQIIAA